MTNTNPTSVYYGRRAAMQSEIGTLDCYEGEWLVQLDGPAGDYDAEGFKTQEAARLEALEMQATYPGIKIIQL